MTTFYKKELSNINKDAVIGDDCTIHSHVWIGAKVTIGARCKIQAHVFIPDGVTIGDDVFIGPGVIFLNDKYPPSHKRSWERTTVMNGVSIGAGSIILPGLVLGESCKIGAGSLVTKNIPPNELWMGSPAHIYQKKTE